MSSGNGKAKGRIFVHCPVYYFDQPDGRQSRFAMCREQASQGWDVYYPDIRQDGLITRVRQKMLSEFMQQGPFDWVFCIDDDIVGPHWTISHLMKRDKDIVGGLYRVKDYDEVKCASMGLDGLRPDARGLIPMRYLSAGSMLVRGEIIERMIEHYRQAPDMPTSWWPDSLEYQDEELGTCWALWDTCVVRDEDHPEGKFLSEDWAFCYRARQMGIEIWGDATLPVGHLMNNVPLYMPNAAAKNPTLHTEGVVKRQGEKVDARHLHV